MRSRNTFRCWRKRILGITLLFALIIISGAIVLADDPILAFLDQSPLELSESSEPIYVALVNNGAVQVKDLQFQVVGLRGPGGELLEDDIFSVQGSADTLEEYSVETFKLTFSPTRPLTDGVYNGFLVVQATGIEPAQKPLIWQADSPSGSDAPAPDSGSLSFVNQEALELKGSLDPVYVAILNKGTETVENIHFHVVGLWGPEGDGVLSVTENNPISLTANSVGTFELAFTRTMDLSDGVYKGFLIVKAKGIVPVPRPLTLKIGQAGSLEFLDTAALKLDYPFELVYYIALKNSTKETAQSIEFQVVALQGPRGESLGDNVLSVTNNSPDNLAADSVATFELAFTKTMNLSDGAYSGFLVAKAAGTTPTPRPLTLQVSGNTLAGLSPEPDSLTIESTTEFWSPIKRIPGLIGIPYPDQGSNVKELATVQLYGQAVGKLQNSIQPVNIILRTEQGREVTATLSLDESDGSLDTKVNATLSLSGLTGPGKYTGALMLDPANPESSKKLNITVSARDCWVWPFIVILLGILVSYYVITLRWGRKRASKSIELQALATLAAIKKDHRAFIANPENESLRGYTIVAGPWKPIVDILGLIRALFKQRDLLNNAKQNSNVLKILRVRMDCRRIHQQLHKDLGKLEQFLTKEQIQVLLDDNTTQQKAQEEAAKLLHLVAEIDSVANPMLDLIIKGEMAEALREAKNHSEELVILVQGASSGSAEKEVEAILDLAAQTKWDEAQKKLKALQDYFWAYQAFRGSAGAMRKNYDQLQKKLDENSEDSVPSLQETANKFFPGCPVQGAGHLAKLAAQVTDLCGFYALFIRIYDRWLQGKAITPGSIPTGSQDEAVWKRAKARLAGVKQDLWAANSAQEVIIRRVEPKVEWALGRLRELKVKYPPPRSPQFSPLLLWSPAYKPTTTLDFSQATPEELERYTLKIRRFIKRGELFFTLIGLLVAVSTAMWFLYAGKPFGTGWDYLAAFFWGSGVDQSLKGLSAVLNKLGIVKT